MTDHAGGCFRGNLCYAPGSDPMSHFCRCRNCQVQTGSGDAINATMTTFTADVHIFTRSQRSWVRRPEGVPAFPVDYERGSLWPQASLQRRRVVV